MSKLSCFAVVIPCITILAGCGKAEVAKVEAPPPERGIYISASDCAESGKLSADLCGQAIDAAVAHHEQNAPIFGTLHQCVVAIGPERCDKTVDGKYRPRLQAFFVVMTNPPTAVPLYPSPVAEVGFRSGSRQSIDARDESLHVSVAALTLAHENAKLPEVDVDYGAALGKAAAEIR